MESKESLSTYSTLTEPGEQGIVRDKQGRFVKGYSGNPKGLPVGTISLVGILRKQLTEHPEDASAIVAALIAMGKGKELGAIKELLDRIDGKVAERHQIEGEFPVKLVFLPADQRPQIGKNALELPRASLDEAR